MNRRVRTLLVRVGPYLVTAAVIVAILRRYPVRDIVRALGEGRALAILPIASVFAILQVLVAGAADTLVIRGVLRTETTHPPRYFDVVRVKAGCAVLQSIGYVLNAGAYATWIARATGSGGKVAAAILVFLAASDLGAGSFFASIATHAAGVDVGLVLRWGTPLIFLAVVGALIGPDRHPVDELGPAPTVRHVFRAPSRIVAATQMGVRVLGALLVVTAIWAAANAFGLHIPYRVAIVYLPLIILIGSLPVNVFGFGPVQGAWLLLSPWAPGAQILAFQFAWNVAILLTYFARGALFVPRILREVAEGAPPEASETNETLERAPQPESDSPR